MFKGGGVTTHTDHVAKKPSMVEAEDSPHQIQTSTGSAQQLEETTTAPEPPTSTEPPTPAKPELPEEPMQLTEPADSEKVQTKEHPKSNGIHADGPSVNGVSATEVAPVQESGQPQKSAGSAPIDTSARLEAMAEERESLRAEVAELRMSLETIKSQHQEELSGLREEIDETQSAKENAETQYHTLLGKVNTIRSQLGERLKADAVRQFGIFIACS